MPDRPAGARLLVVEDDAATREAVGRNLTAHGYRVVEAGDVADALRRWDTERPDLILLDLGLPDLDGTAVVRHVRRDATTPILILSARTDERDKVACLEAGADDYVTKPFGLDELRARVGALLRRAGGPAAAPDGGLRLGPIRLDPGTRAVTVDAHAGRPHAPRIRVAQGDALPARSAARPKAASCVPCGVSPTRMRATTCMSTSADCDASSTPPTRQVRRAP